MSGDLSLDEFEALFNAHTDGIFPVAPHVETFHMLDQDDDMKISVTEILFYMDIGYVYLPENGHTY